MEKEGNRFLYKGGTGEIEVKKSRFIAELVPVTSEEEALAFVAAKKKQYWDARHNCHAYIIGSNPGIQRFSDDGEPGGTAGKPMLEILQHEAIEDAAVVVTRYFGGVLLGTGGLIRAYQGAVQEALKACQVGNRFLGVAIEAVMNYTALGKVQYALKEEKGVFERETVYEDNVTMRVVSPVSEKERILKLLRELLGGQGEIRTEEPEWFDEAEGKIID